MKDTISDNISGLVENIKNYITAKADLYLLTTFEKVGKFQSYLLSSIIMILIVFFSVFFITIALALWLGELVDSPKWGFVIMAGFYLLFAVIFYVFKKQLIDRNVIKNLMKIIFPEEKN